MTSTDRQVRADAGQIGRALHRRAWWLELTTTGWNIVEAGLAVGSGAVAGSAALIAFGADSLIEVASALVVIWRLIRAGPEASEDVHAATDRRAHLLVGLTFFLLAGYVVVDAGGALLRGEGPERSWIGLGLAAVSLVAMPALAVAKGRVGRAMGSKALQADAVETWMCAYLSGTLLIGLGLHIWRGWWWADPAAALAMVPFVVWQGWETVQEAREGDQESEFE